MKNENRHTNDYLSNQRAPHNGDDAKTTVAYCLRVSRMWDRTQIEVGRSLRLLFIWRSWMSVSEEHHTMTPESVPPSLNVLLSRKRNASCGKQRQK